MSQLSAFVSENWVASSVAVAFIAIMFILGRIAHPRKTPAVTIPTEDVPGMLTEKESTVFINRITVAMRTCAWAPVFAHHAEIGSPSFAQVNTSGYDRAGQDRAIQAVEALNQFYYELQKHRLAQAEAAEEKARVEADPDAAPAAA